MDRHASCRILTEGKGSNVDTDTQHALSIAQAPGLENHHYNCGYRTLNFLASFSTTCKSLLNAIGGRLIVDSWWCSCRLELREDGRILGLRGRHGNCTRRRSSGPQQIVAWQI